MVGNGLPAGFTLDQAPSQEAAPTEAGGLPPGFALDEEKYGTAGQTALAIGEGAVKGLISRPGYAYVAKKLTQYGVPGLTPEEQAGREVANPYLQGGAEALGLIGPALLTGGEAPLYTQSGVLTKLGEGISTALGLGGKGASLASRMGARVVSGAAENVAFGAGDLGAQVINGKSPSEAIEIAIPYLTLSTILGGTGGAIFGAVPELWSAVKGEKTGQLMDAMNPSSSAAIGPNSDLTLKSVIKKGIATYLGVSPEQVDAYLANNVAINQVPEFEEIYAHAYDHVSNINEQLAAKQITAMQAEKSFNDYAQDLKNAFKQQGFEAKVGDTVAQNALKQAQNNLALSIQGRALNTSQPIFEAMQKLRSDVHIGSSNAFDVLSQAEEPVSLKPFYNQISNLQDELKSKATIESRSMADRLGQYAEGVQQEYGNSVRPPAAKLIIQGLDGVSNYNFNASTFDNGLSRYYKQIRYGLDDLLKDDVEGYRAAMKPVADDTSLLRSLEDYGTPEDATSRIKSLKNPDRYKNEMPLLQKLQDKGGPNFINDIDNYANPKIREQLMKALPEYKEAQKTSAALEALRNPKTQLAFNEELNQLPQAKALQAAQAELEQAKLAKEGIKGLTPATLEGKLKTVMRGKGFEARKIVSQIPELDGKSIPELLDLLHVKNAFEKANMNGSRNVNMFGSMGASLGALSGAPVIGAGIGAQVGGYLDKYGPATAKKMLDRYIDQFGEVAKPGPGSNPSAIKSALYKMVLSGKPNNPEALKAMADHYGSVVKGENLITNAAKNVFSGASKVIPAQFYPDESSRDKLKKSIDNANIQQYAHGGMVGYYLPEHQTAAAALQAKSLNYLRSLKPTQVQMNPLDKPLLPNKYKEAQFNRQLDIADQPLLTLQHTKDGTLQPQDVQTINTLYPNLHSHLIGKTFEAMNNAMTDGQQLTNKQKMSLSLLMGKPLDSNLTPMGMQSIIAANMNSAPQSQPNQVTKESSASMDKVNSLYQTPTQASAAKRTEAS